MRVSFISAVTAGCSHLSDAVLRPPQKKALLQFGPVLRDFCSSFYFEWHLEDPLRVDLLASLTYDNNDRLISHLNQAAGNSSDVKTHQSPGRKFTALFADCMPVLSRWKEMQRALKNRLPHIWFAWDYSPREERFSPPNIHFCIDRNFTNRTRERSYTNALSLTQFEKIVDTLLDADWPAEAVWSRHKLKKSYRLLHSLDGEVIHLSFMHSRRPAIAKLNMTVPSGALESLLKKLHWPGEAGRIVDQCVLFTQKESRIKGNICFADGEFQRFELELEYNFPLMSDRRRRTMLQHLVETHLSARRQTSIMRQWPGRDDFTFRRQHGTLERWLDCKLCFTPDGTVFAKPYFGFATLPRIGWNRDVLYE